MNKAIFNIYFDRYKENVIYHNDNYFDFNYEKEWLIDDFAVKIIKDIEKGEVIGGQVILTEMFGAISPRDISTGVKTLLLLKYYEGDLIFNGSQMGENCIKYLVEIAREHPVNIILFNIPNLDDIENAEFNYIDNNFTLTNSEMFSDITGKYLIEQSRRVE